ncbi:MAG TPA: glycosyltransferase family 2 protein [Candidatus Omnitrophota bacterium]|nr:glycosyltransferase family 2 protein [Candidatus Omnitrophota bacterium]
MPKEKLSVVVLTKNEEKNIIPCLETVKWADEIIVMDDNSTDNTVELARRFTDKVFVSAMNRDFAKQRNYSISLCGGDWILQMDADERVTEGLKKRIQGLLEKGSDCVAFKYRRLNYFCGAFLRHGGEGEHKSLRLFRKESATFHGRDDIIEVSGKVGEWDEVMEHYNFPDIDHYVLTQNFYSRTEAEDMTAQIKTMPYKKLRSELTIKPAKLFFKLYFKKQGYKDGARGLIFAALSAWRRFLRYAKYWELNREFYDAKR